MKYLHAILGLLILTMFTNCQAQIPNKQEQIDAAVQAVPEDKRDNATVLGYNSNNEIVQIREGSNEFVCLSDDPTKEGFSVACYHKDLEPFMARGRELRAEGKTGSEVFDIRAEEAKSGELSMPENPATLYVLAGANGQYDAASGKVKNAKLRYVVYIPYATAESTGLPTKPQVAGGPWIMDPGTHKAHIMVTPPSK